MGHGGVIEGVKDRHLAKHIRRAAPVHVRWGQAQKPGFFPCFGARPQGYAVTVGEARVPRHLFHRKGLGRRIVVAMLHEGLQPLLQLVKFHAPLFFYSGAGSGNSSLSTRFKIFPEGFLGMLSTKRTARGCLKRARRLWQ